MILTAFIILNNLFNPIVLSKTENFFFKDIQTARNFAVAKNDKLLKRCLHFKGADTSSCKNGVFHTKICKYQFNRETKETIVSIKTSRKEEYHTQVKLINNGKKFCRIFVDLNSTYNRYCGEIALSKRSEKLCPKHFYIMQISSGRYKTRSISKKSHFLPVVLEHDDI